MIAICEADVKAVVGETDMLVNAQWTLSTRVQHLVDLVSVTEFGDGEKRSAA